jgi:replicative DNA helicase
VSDEGAQYADELGRRLFDAEQTPGGGWKGTCPRCGGGPFWVLKSGFSCSQLDCGWQGINLDKLKLALDQRDGVQEFKPGRVEAPAFDRVLGPLLDEVDRKKKEPVDAVPTHLPIWNRCCRDEGGGVGLARGWHLIVAGNTGMGKSLLALNIAAHAVRKGERVGLISLEMSQIQAVTRYMAIFSNTQVQRLEHGSGYHEESAYQVKCQLEENYERNGGVLVTNRRPISKLSDIVSAMKYLREHENCRYFVTDYLQLAWTGNAEKQNDRITEVSHTVRSTATDLGVISIGVSQFNRTTSTSKERPTIQGLMGGSSLENDSEQILLLDHTSFRRFATGEGIIKLLLAKNRHGSDAEVPLSWDYDTLKCSETDPKRFERKNEPPPPS